MNQGMRDSRWRAGRRTGRLLLVGPLPVSLLLVSLLPVSSLLAGLVPEQPTNRPAPRRTLLAAAASGSQTAANETGPLEEAARKALRARGGKPWYDPRADQLKRFDVPPYVARDASNRDSDWDRWGIRWPEWKWFWKWNWNRTGAGGSWGTGWQVLQGLFWFVLAVVLIALVGLLIWAFVRSDFGEGDEEEFEADSGPLRSDAERIENLPFDVRRPSGDLLSEARRHYESGRFREAVIYLFSYQLVQLDRYQLIQLNKGKTNRQYLRETRRGRPAVAPILHQTMICFEEVFFGNYDLNRERFERSWKRLDEFHHQVQQVSE